MFRAQTWLRVGEHLITFSSIPVPPEGWTPDHQGREAEHLVFTTFIRDAGCLGQWVSTTEGIWGTQHDPGRWCLTLSNSSLHYHDISKPF